MNNSLDINKLWEIYKSLLLSTKRKGINELITWLENSDFKIAPASTRYHNCFEGGLLAHSLNVYNEAVKQKDLIKLFNIPMDSIIITSLLHDICKVNYYKTEMRNVKVNGQWVQEPFYLVDDMFPIGHAEKSIIIAQEFIKLTDVEVAMIRGHMGGFVSDQYFNVSALNNKYPEAIILQHADMVATYVLESEGMLEDFRERLQEYINKK
ncbi:MAG: hydrolase [Romboutsia timonensis]